MRNKYCVPGLIAAGLALAGCAPLLLGAGAVGGYAVSKDSVVDHFDLPKETVYRTAFAEVKKMGQVTLEAPKQGVIEARVDDVNVRITVEQLTERTTRLKIRARNKLLMPKVEVAQKVYAGIKERL